MDNPREVAGRIVQSVWRGLGQAGREEAKTVGQKKKKGFRTLEIEGGNPPQHQAAGSGRQHAGEGWAGARPRRNSSSLTEGKQVAYS